MSTQALFKRLIAGIKFDTKKFSKDASKFGLTTQKQNDEAPSGPESQVQIPVYSEVKAEIKEKIRATESDLRDLGNPMPLDQASKQQLLFNMINEFVNTYKNTISGRFDNKRVINSNMNKSNLSGGAKLKEHFY